MGVPLVDIRVDVAHRWSHFGHPYRRYDDIFSRIHRLRVNSFETKVLLAPQWSRKYACDVTYHCYSYSPPHCPVKLLDGWHGIAFFDPVLRHSCKFLLHKVIRGLLLSILIESTLLHCSVSCEPECPGWNWLDLSSRIFVLGKLWVYLALAVGNRLKYDIQVQQYITGDVQSPNFPTPRSGFKAFPTVIAGVDAIVQRSIYNGGWYFLRYDAMQTSSIRSGGRRDWKQGVWGEWCPGTVMNLNILNEAFTPAGSIEGSSPLIMSAKWTILLSLAFLQ